MVKDCVLEDSVNSIYKGKNQYCNAGGKEINCSLFIEE